MDKYKALAVRMFLIHRALSITDFYLFHFICSLGGNTKTAIICTVTAAEEEQTKSTLEFAARAKSIVNHAEVLVKTIIKDHLHNPHLLSFIITCPL